MSVNQVDFRVIDRIDRSMTAEFINASSLDHTYGNRAEQAAKHLADLTEASPREIILPKI